MRNRARVEETTNLRIFIFELRCGTPFVGYLDAWYNMLMDFEGQRADEEVKYIFRRHPITAIKGVFFLIVMVAVGYLPTLMWPGDSRMFLVWLAFSVVGLLGLGYCYMLWYFSFYMLTNQRLRQVRQKGMFKKTVVDLDLENILSASYGQHGVFATIFNYGTILVQTSAGDLTMSMVSKPETVYNELGDAAHIARKVEEKENED